MVSGRRETQLLCLRCLFVCDALRLNLSIKDHKAGDEQAERNRRNRDNAGQADGIQNDVAQPEPTNGRIDDLDDNWRWRRLHGCLYSTCNSLERRGFDLLQCLLIFDDA